MIPCRNHERCWVYQGRHHWMARVGVNWNRRIQQYESVYVHAPDCASCLAGVL